MVTLLDVFQLSCNLIDETLATGAVNATTTAVYKARTVGLLNIWQSEMSTELLLDVSPVTLTAITDTLAVNYPNCAAYFLSAHLMLVEDSAMASFFNQRYEEIKAKIIRNRPAKATRIVDIFEDYTWNVANGYKGTEAEFDLL